MLRSLEFNQMRLNLELKLEIGIIFEFYYLPVRHKMIMRIVCQP